MPSNENAVLSYDAMPDAPDFLGVASRVQSVADLIQSAQAQHQELRGLLLLNGHSEDDTIPTANGDGTATYKERFASLRTGVSSLVEANKDIADELTAEAVRRRKKLERKLESEAD